MAAKAHYRILDWSPTFQATAVFSYIHKKDEKQLAEIWDLKSITMSIKPSLFSRFSHGDPDASRGCWQLFHINAFKWALTLKF